VRKRKIYLLFILKNYLKKIQILFYDKNDEYFLENEIWKKKKKDLEQINFL
jgi:hypothetical protein